jgi:hypothetical protein
MKGVLSISHTVTLNLFQGPSMFFSFDCASQWMLKQVQHDELVWEVTE